MGCGSRPAHADKARPTAIAEQIFERKLALPGIPIPFKSQGEKGIKNLPLAARREYRMDRRFKACDFGTESCVLWPPGPVVQLKPGEDAKRSPLY
jgi:hypothetical protein